jgi:hypothetical protein
MLYDPKWDSPSREGFIRFCESKPPEEQYSYNDGSKCAVGQYYRKCGLFSEWMFRISEPTGHELMYELDMAAHASRTFGALAVRLRME